MESDALSTSEHQTTSTLRRCSGNESPHISELLASVAAYVEGGLSLIPVNGKTKQPFFDLLPRNGGKASWTLYMSQRASQEEVERWVISGAQLAAVTGYISGGLLVIDFDVARFYDAWVEAVGELAEGLPVQRTGREGGAYQVWLRCPEPGGNTELAYMPDDEEETGRKVAIETRGGREFNGEPSCGYAILAPSIHPSGRRYEVIKGDFAAIPKVSQACADALLAAARKLCEAPKTRQQLETEIEEQASVNPLYQNSLDGQRSIIDEYNSAHKIEEVLERYGYSRNGQRYVRPGGERTSIAVRDGRCFHHNANDPLTDGYWHTPFHVFCFYEHNGDVKSAVKAAASLGLTARNNVITSKARPDYNGSNHALQEPPIFSQPPQPITTSLRPVPPLDKKLLPEPLCAWIVDIAERMSCPLEYPAIAALVAVSALVGRKVGVRPKQQDDWLVVPNLWGAIIGPPGVQKSPAVEEAMRPLKRLVVEAQEVYTTQKKDYEIDTLLRKAQAKSANVTLEKKVKEGKSSDSELKVLAQQAALQDDPEAPVLKRYIVNDVTVEALGERLKENPNGLLLYRDELAGFLRSLDKHGHETDRAFFLEAWNGTGENFTYDRIGRGTVIIAAVCISILGTIQPGPISRYIRTAGNSNSLDEGADGLIQRFQLMVYPDTPPWKPVDRQPNAEAKNQVFEIFKVLNSLVSEHIGAEVPASGGIPYLHFHAEAQEFFNEWRNDLEINKLRSCLETPFMEAHLSKYRSLMPALALLLHLIDVAVGKTSGAISYSAAERAAAWCDLLENHARRIYEMSSDVDIEAALSLINHLKQDLPNPFTVRDVVRKGWAGLKNTEDVERVIDLLVDKGWVQVREIPSGIEGGRPSHPVWINPLALAKAKDQ